jgi:hypothetical protein
VRNVRLYLHDRITFFRDVITLGREVTLPLSIPPCPLCVLPPYLFQGDLLPVLDGVENDVATGYALYAASFILSLRR